jgi:hypothetical protein
MSDVLDRVSSANLDRLCHLAFWTGLGGDRQMSWGETREEMERYLAGVPRDVIGRFQEFLKVEDTITVPEDHPTRVANLPPVVRKMALDVMPLLFQQRSEQEALEQAVSEEESALLLRWATWTGEIPRHAFWHTPPDGSPSP